MLKSTPKKFFIFFSFFIYRFFSLRTSRTDLHDILYGSTKINVEDMFNDLGLSGFTEGSGKII
jgi:hypothetical protein